MTGLGIAGWVLSGLLLIALLAGVGYALWVLWTFTFRRS